MVNFAFILWLVRVVANFHQILLAAFLSYHSWLYIFISEVVILAHFKKPGLQQCQISTLHTYRSYLICFFWSRPDRKWHVNIIMMATLKLQNQKNWCLLPWHQLKHKNITKSCLWILLTQTPLPAMNCVHLSAITN